MVTTDAQRGTLLGILAYVIWGLAALFWVQTQPVDSRDLLAHRALWSVPFVMLCLLFAGHGRLRSTFLLFRNPRILGVMAAAAACGAINWGIFLWAVTNERATEASLGYFLLPLVNVVTGVVLFRESIDRPQQVGIAFAVAAVLVQLVFLGGLPWIGLGVALSFGLYGAIRKFASVESMEGLLLETLLMAPFALLWLWSRDGGGLGMYGLKVDIFLVAAGAFTAIPLMAYVAASRLMALSALGLVFYIGPTLQFLVAVFVFREPFACIQFIAFGLVWIGLAVVTGSALQRARNLRRYGKTTGKNLS